MMSLVPTITDNDFQNWLRGSLALLYTKQGLYDLVNDELTQFQKDLLTSIITSKHLPAGALCNTCTTENVLPCPTHNFCTRGRRCKFHDPRQPDKKPNQPCPNQLCEDIRDGIRNEHRYNGPSWKNTDARGWCINALELAKCYMPPDGYLAVTTLDDTDFNGTLAVIINNTRFQNKMAAQLNQPVNICIEARDIGRVIRHSSNLAVTDTELVQYIDTLIDLLSDPKYLAANLNAREAVNKLNQLKLSTLTISTADIITVLDNALKDITTRHCENALKSIRKRKEKAEKEIEEKTQKSLQLLSSIKISLINIRSVSASSLNKIIREKLAAIKEIKIAGENEKQEIVTISASEKRKMKETIASETAGFKKAVEDEKEELTVLSKQVKQRVKEEIAKDTDEFKKVVEKEKQNITTTSAREQQLIKEKAGTAINEFKKVADKEKQNITTTSARRQQLIEEKAETEIKKIKRAAEKEKQELTDICKKRKRNIQEDSGPATVSCPPQQLVPQMNITTERQELEKSLREDLLTYYRQYYNKIPIAPLVEEHDVELVDFYVQPPLTAIDLEKTFGQFPAAPTRTAVQSYRDLFHGTDGNPYKNIYITANAGIGKTSFVKKICMTWYQAHGPLEARKMKFKPDDVDEMRQFEFLFVISLRDINTAICNIDTMICSQVIGSLAGHQYSEHFVKDILKQSKCLIVLDGLDEWSHPTNCRRGCPNVHEIHIPHRPARERCSVLTTSRPWKFYVAKLGTNQIDRHVEINELDKSSSEQLISNALTVLNKKSKQNQPKTTEEFRTATYSKTIKTIRYIPYVLLQLICLWFDGKSIGNSRCEIYSNVVDLTFTRGLMKCGEQVSSLESRERPDNYNVIPLCLRYKECCKIFYNVLLRLGKIAFQTLFVVEEESSLAFDKTVILKCVSEKTLKVCLEMGFLSQNKAYGCVSSRQSTFSFQHKSLQEYFAALYIQSESDNKDVQHTIYKKCKTLATVLEMSNVFIFLGGLKPEACQKILPTLQDAISTDQITHSYRNVALYSGSFLKNKYLNTMTDLQSMQTDIVNEILNNDLKYVPPFIEDILLHSTTDKNTYPLLKLLIEKNKTNIKSLYIYGCPTTDEFTEILDTLELRNVHSLHKLEIAAVPRQQDLHRLLSGSTRTLTCLGLHFVALQNHKYYTVYTNISTETIRTIISMDRLVSLSLRAVCLPHLNINELLSFITGKTTMIGIELHAIKCTDHKGECTGICLDLSKHQKLETLQLYNIVITKLQVNTSSLKTCCIRDLPVDVYSSLLKDLQHATGLRGVAFGEILSEVMLENIVKTLRKLENLKVILILNSDLGNKSLIVPTEMKRIEKVCFYMVTTTSVALRKCIHSIDLLPQSVSIALRACTVIQQKEYEQIKDEIRASPQYKVEFDGLNNLNDYCFEFHSVGQNLQK